MRASAAKALGAVLAVALVPVGLVVGHLSDEAARFAGRRHEP